MYPVFKLHCGHYTDTFCFALIKRSTSDVSWRRSRDTLRCYRSSCSGNRPCCWSVTHFKTVHTLYIRYRHSWLCTEDPFCLEFTVRIFNAKFLLNKLWSRVYAQIVPLIRLASKTLWNMNSRIVLSTKMSNKLTITYPHITKKKDWKMKPFLSYSTLSVFGNNFLTIILAK